MSNENCVFSLKTQKEEQRLMTVKREEGKERGGESEKTQRKQEMESSVMQKTK